ncbi:MAG TPA: DciA family protein [Tessaracoccus flavescens]|uniref:DciA family protein n=1 Tax=Tessaracoccus flavescens TaxID=399497 RepID=A0A921ENX7_9ACTN|nr:DciA family protein [Tessaracoccus flavescens]
MTEQHDPTGLDLASEIARAAVEASAYGVVLPEAKPPKNPPRRHRPQEQQRSGAHPDDRDPQLVGDVLESVIKERGWKRRIGLSTVLRRWPELVGESNAEHSKPVNFADGILTVDCDSTAWATAMRYTASQLVARLNDKLGERTVLRVEFRGPKAPSWKKGPRSVSGRGPRDTYG